MLGRIFYFVSSILFLFGAFIFLSPSLLTPDLIYPERIDSTYIAYHAALDGDEDDTLIFSPSDLGLKFSDISITTNDGLILNGWYVSAQEELANTILIIHDLNESKLLYIDHLKQFHDRGFNVCSFDLRAHGNSGGIEFTPGLPSVEDTKLIIDSIFAKKETRHLAIMGVGIGAAIALQTAVYDNRCQGLVLQNPFNRYEDYLSRYSKNKWGIMNNFWYPVFKRREESLLQYPIKQLDLAEIASYTTIPTFFVIGSEIEKVSKSETLVVLDASNTEKKELFLVSNARSQNIAKAGGELYYNRIAGFLISYLPKELKITRYKKLALNDN